jgi:hypothetical protein
MRQRGYFPVGLPGLYVMTVDKPLSDGMAAASSQTIGSTPRICLVQPHMGRGQQSFPSKCGKREPRSGRHRRDNGKAGVVLKRPVGSDGPFGEHAETAEESWRGWTSVELGPVCPRQGDWNVST